MPYKKTAPTADDIVGKADTSKTQTPEEPKKLEEQPIPAEIFTPAPTPVTQSQPMNESHNTYQQRPYQRRMVSSQDSGGYSGESQIQQEMQGPSENVAGVLDVQPEGHGFLRPKFIPSSRDIYISQSQIRRFMLRPGDFVAGVARPPKDNERYYGLLKVEKVNDVEADASDRKSTRLNSSHQIISYAVFCLKKKKKMKYNKTTISEKQRAGRHPHGKSLRLHQSTSLPALNVSVLAQAFLDVQGYSAQSDHNI